MDRRGMKPARIEVNIEELVLYGFSPADRYRIGEAMQQELSRLLAEEVLPSGLGKVGEVDRLDGGAFWIKQGLRARAVGAEAARSVYRRMKR